jgi:mono/diheme cytochrome c family protein
LLPKLPRSDDTTAPIVDRVGAYLETNCSYCHRPAGGGRGEFSLERSRFLSGLCNQTPQSAAFDDPTMKLIKPGDPAHSVVLRRMMETTLPYQMHPYRMSVDAVGVALVNEWITTTAAADCASVQ